MHPLGERGKHTHAHTQCLGVIEEGETHTSHLGEGLNLDLEPIEALFNKSLNQPLRAKVH